MEQRCENQNYKSRKKSIEERRTSIYHLAQFHHSVPLFLSAPTPPAHPTPHSSPLPIDPLNTQFFFTPLLLIDMQKQAIVLMLLLSAALAACPANYNISNLAADYVTFTANSNSSSPSQTFAYAFPTAFSSSPVVALGLQDFSLNYLGANSMAIYPSLVSGSQIIFNWEYSFGVWSRVRISFWASGNSEMQLGYFRVDSIQTQPACNCAQVFSALASPFGAGDSPVIRVFINGFDVSSSSLQISVSPSNLQGTKLSITVTVGSTTVLKRLWLSWLAFSPGTASFGSYGGQYSQSKYSGTVSSDISNSLYQTPYIFHGLNLLSLSNAQPLVFSSAADSNFVLTVSASRLVDDFSIVYIAVGVLPGKHCSSCGSGLLACGTNCQSTCTGGSFPFTYKDGGVACRTCSAKLGQILANGKCVQGSVTTQTTTISSNMPIPSQQYPSSAVPPVITIPSSVLYSPIPAAQPDIPQAPPSYGLNQSSLPPRSCPPNAFFNGNECVCDVGYVWTTGKCQAPVIPATVPTIILNPNQPIPSTPTPPSPSSPIISNPTPIVDTPELPPVLVIYPSPQPSASSASCGPNSYNNGLGICVCNQGCYFLNNSCVPGVPCSVNSNRAPNGTCVCDPGFTNYSGVCSKCPQGALWSSSANQCIFVCGQNSAYSASAGACVCNSGYGKLGSVCQACPQGYFISNGYCVTCPVNSVYNSASGNCDCASGFFTNQWGICARKCGTNEIYNSATQTCSCLLGLGRVNGACQICPAGSTPTSDGSACSACGPNQVLVGGNCVCNQGFAFNSAGICTACSSLPNGFLVNGICAVCPGSTIYNGNTCSCPLGKISQGSLCISQCQSDEVLDSKGNCFTCQCNQIISRGVCTCAQGYIRQPNGVCALACTASQFVFQGSICAACPLNTVFNAGVNGCTCPTGYYMDNYNTCQKLVLQPVSCPAGQYFDMNNGCQACSSACKTCKSATQCLTCSSAGFTVNGQGACVAQCGDGLIVGGQTCDTGSSYSAGCISCQIQSGYTCSGQPSNCKSLAPTPTPTLPLPPVPIGSNALVQTGSTSINSNNVFISLQTNPTFTFNNPTEMQNFMQSSFPSGPKPTVYCAQRNSPNLNIFDCLLIYPSGVPNSQFTVNFSYNYQGRTGSTTVKVNPLTASNARGQSGGSLSVDDSSSNKPANSGRANN